MSHKAARKEQLLSLLADDYEMEDLVKDSHGFYRPRIYKGGMRLWLPWMKPCWKHGHEWIKSEELEEKGIKKMCKRCKKKVKARWFVR